MSDFKRFRSSQGLDVERDGFDARESTTSLTGGTTFLSSGESAHRAFCALTNYGCGLPKIRRLTLALVAALAFGGATAVSLTAADLAGWLENWSLPQFSKEGHRTMTARGTRARVDPVHHQYEVVDLNLTLFSGDAATRVETILLSPSATFLPNENIAHGEKSVRFIGENIEASGTRWVYRHGEKKISLDGDVRVTFSAELENLLQ